MIHDPSGPGAAPLAVLCKDVSKLEEFQDRHKKVYKYEVLGGLHSFLAKCQLTQEFPQNPYFKVAMADVYVGLNDEQALRLAQRHNQNSHFTHKVTHRDLVCIIFLKCMYLFQFLQVETCRARLYRMARKDVLSNETPIPTPAWKDSCKAVIIPKVSIIDITS